MNIKFLRDITHVLSSNLISLIISLVTTLVIPQLLSPENFGLFQLFLFYSSFIGIFMLGIGDGIYLVLGGTSYEKLNKNEFSSIYWMINIYLGIISLCFTFISYFVIDDFDLRIIFICVGLTIFLQGLNSFFILINQALSRFKIYSIMNVIEKLILLVYIVLKFILKEKICYTDLLYVTLFAKLISLIMNIFFDNKIVFSKVSFSKKILNNITEYIKIGLPLTFSGVISMSIPGVGKQLVQSNLGSSQFGLFSLNFSIMGIVTQVISAFSIVFYPLLRNKKDDELISNVLFIENTINFISIYIYILYYPISILIIKILPNYEGTLRSLIFMLPVLIFQAKNSILYLNILKAKRKERELLYIGMVVLVFSYIFTKICFWISSTILAVSFSTMISYCFWNIISRYLISKEISLLKSNDKQMYINLIIFVFLNFGCEFKTSLILYLLFVIVVTIKNIDKIKLYVSIFKRGGLRNV